MVLNQRKITSENSVVQHFRVKQDTFVRHVIFLIKNCLYEMEDHWCAGEYLYYHITSKWHGHCRQFAPTLWNIKMIWDLACLLTRITGKYLGFLGKHLEGTCSSRLYRENTSLGLAHLSQTDTECQATLLPCCCPAWVSATPVAEPCAYTSHVRIISNSLQASSAFSHQRHRDIEQHKIIWQEVVV